MLSVEMYRDIFYAIVAIWSIPEIIGTIAQRRRNVGSQHDQASFYVMLATLFLGLVISTEVSFWTVSPIVIDQPSTSYWIGIVLMLGGVVFRWYAIRYLGQYFSRVVKVQANQQVVNTGPYHWIRHPSYSGSLITLLGYGLVLNNWFSLLTVLALQRKVGRKGRGGHEKAWYP